MVQYNLVYLLFLPLGSCALLKLIYGLFARDRCLDEIGLKMGMRWIWVKRRFELGEGGSLIDCVSELGAVCHLYEFMIIQSQ